MLRLRSQVLLIALLPAALLTCIIGGYILATRIADLRDSQTQLGEGIVRQLAPASEYAVFSGNQQVLDRMAENLVAEPGIRRLTIRDAEGAMITEAESEPPDVDLSLMNRLYPVTESDLTFRATIEMGDEPGGEFEALFTDDGGSRSGPVDRILGEVEIQLSAAPLMRRQAEVLTHGFALILGGLLLVWLVAARAGLKMVRPINRVVAAISQFRDGKQDIRVPEDSRGEAGLLERGFNELAEEVQRSHEDLSSQVDQATAELRETLEAVEIKNVELDLARKRAEASNQIKSEFLANISHEIRTPMNAIFGYTQLLSRTQLQTNQKEYISTIQGSAESLLALLEDVLNLSRIEAGRIDVETTACQPEALIEETLSMIAPKASERSLELFWTPLCRLPEEVRLDKVKVRQILGNLLSNAEKFTDRGYVELQADIQSDEKKGQWLSLSVLDTGIGIKDDDSWKLFQPFSQLDSSSSRRHQGAGLGLVISQQLAQLMGGRIEFSSEPGMGSRFTLILPVEIIRSAKGLPLADQAIRVFSQHPALARSLARRLETWGASVHVLNDIQGLRDACSKKTDNILTIINIEQETLKRDEIFRDLFLPVSRYHCLNPSG